MKRYLILVFLLSFFPVSAGANEQFLGAPVIKGDVTHKSEDRLEIKTDLSHDEALSFYREALKDLKDIKYREWKDATYIEDDGALSWHSITISKGEKNQTGVVIVKDNWTWIIGTLVLRYIGVFVVLMVLFGGLSLSGKIISGAVKKTDAKKEVK